YNPFKGGIPYPNNQIPASDISPVTAAVLNSYIPAPPPGANTISYAIPNSLDDDQYMVRVDHSFTDRNRLMGRFFTSEATQAAFLAPGNYFSSTPGANWRNTSVGASDPYTISPNLVNSLLFSFNRTNNLTQPIYPAKGLAALGSDMYNDSMPEIY